MIRAMLPRSHKQQHKNSLIRPISSSQNVNNRH